MLWRRRAKTRRSAPRAWAVVIALALAAAVGVSGEGAAAPGGASGTLLAFGSNSGGQLGFTASLTPNPTPTPVALPGQIGPVVRATAGYAHSLVVTSSGQVYAFGSNTYGQLGLAANSGTATPTPVPSLVTLPGQVGTVTQVVSGAYHSLVVTSSGQLYAFGYNFEGALGNAIGNGTNIPNPTPTPVGLPGAIGPVVQVANGYVHSLVLTSSGQLYSFGDNSSGQLGRTANTTPNPIPTLVTLPGQLGPITRIAAGAFDTLVLTASGQLYAFGLNASGQLGNASNNGTNNPNATPTLVTLPGATGTIVNVASSAYATYALTSSGQLYAFGYNLYGQLGLLANSGTATANPTPAVVTLPGQIGTITQIAGGAITPSR